MNYFMEGTALYQHTHSCVINGRTASGEAYVPHECCCTQINVRSLWSHSTRLECDSAECNDKHSIFQTLFVNSKALKRWAIERKK